MKKNYLYSFLILLLCVISLNVSAYNIEVPNTDGVTIYYNYINNNTELEVTFLKKGSPSYSGIVVIPEEVTDNGKTLKVTSISPQAFDSCTDLVSVTIPNSVTTIRDRAFAYCYSLASVNIPSSVTSIGNNAFQYCYTLTSVTIPNSVTKIGPKAFQNCFGLLSVTIPGSMANIDDCLFKSCTSLSSVTISYGVNSIGTEAFSGCTKLASVSIPNSMTSISEQAFKGCTGLTSISIPNSVTFIGKDAFTETAWFESQPNDVVYVGSVLYIYKGIMPPNTSIVIKDGIKYIAEAAFKKCSGLTSVTISNNVEIIGPEAFYECEGLTSVSIPNSVTTIEKRAFSGCSSLPIITIPSSVSNIGQLAFNGCLSLSAVHITDLDAWCKIQFGNEKYSNPLYSAHHLFFNGEEIKDLVISNNVTNIGNYAFTGCYGLTSVTIPSNVTNIGSFSFSDCNNMTKVKLIGNSIVSREYSDNYLINDIFGNQVKEYILEGDVISIGQKAFAGCKNLISISIPNSVTNIGSGAFKNCTSLTSITIPNSVTSIASETFSGCSSLTSISIPNKVTSIEKEAFFYCTSLSSVIIPNTMKTIGSSSFNNCSALKDMYCYAEEVPYTESWVFYSSTNNATLHVPAASVSLYQNAIWWNEFMNIVALTDDDPKPTGIQGINNNVTTADYYYSLDGKRMLTPKPGLNIIRMNDGTTKKVIMK